jgi:hypothetical protein
MATSGVFGVRAGSSVAEALILPVSEISDRTYIFTVSSLGKESIIDACTVVH